MIWLISYQMSAVLVLVIVLYKYLTRNHNHWRKKGIPTAGGLLPGFGHMLSIYTLRKNLVAQLWEIYEAFDTSMVGLFDQQTPVLMIREPELVKTVLQTEFASFCDHMPLDLEADPLLGYDPFFVNGATWKKMRALFTRAFPTKKLRFISSIAEQECQKLVRFIDRKLDGEEREEAFEVDAKGLFSRFTSQVAANAIFGVDAEGFEEVDPPESFYSMMSDVFEGNLLRGIRQIIIFYLPSVRHFLKVSFVPSRINRRFPEIVGRIRELRSREAIERDDLLQYLIDNDEQYRNMVAPNAFLFMIEIYETSSLVLTTTAYLLSKHQKVQDRAREEVIKVMDRYGDQGLCYEAINEMTYLDQILNEAIRLFSPIGIMVKICTKFVTLQGSDGLSCFLEPGDQVAISLVGIHRNPKIWENSNEFNPDRFAKGSTELSRGDFLGFGEGPRKCPGIRMAMIQVKAAMATILKNYEIEPSRRTIEPIKLEPKVLFTSFRGSCWVKLRRL